MGVVSRIKIMADTRHLREARAPGRPLRADRRRAPRGHPRGDAAARQRRGRGHAHPRQGRRWSTASSRSGCRTAELERFDRAIQQAQRRGARDGPDGLGQVDHAVRRAARAQRRRAQHPHDRGPRRAADRRASSRCRSRPRRASPSTSGLRSMLRADPDVIMVGEIRDRETAHIAVEAALTGHLVLSTLHTRDAPSALGRLIDMGIEPFLVSSAVDCIVAQRLVRMLCTHCKRPQKVSEAVLAEHGLAGCRAVRGGGLLALRRLRLPRPPRAVRGDDRQRADPRADPRARLGRRHGRGRRRGRHAPAARRRPGEGARGPDLDRRGRTDDRPACSRALGPSGVRAPACDDRRRGADCAGRRRADAVPERARSTPGSSWAGSSSPSSSCRASCPSSLDYGVCGFGFSRVPPE